MADETQASLVQVLRSTLRELLDSKKFVTSFTAAMASMLVAYAGKKGIVLDNDLASEFIKIMLGGAGLFVASQGVADHGKERAKVEADTAA